MVWIPPVATMVTDPPGKAVIRHCQACDGRGHHSYQGNTYQCRDCEGRGRALWRACPNCSAIDWDFLNGRTEEGGMACRVGCGYVWRADHPAWVVQHWPDAA